jgi:uroporphyrinogen decarboxylase
MANSCTPMSSKQRMLTAIQGGVPDRLPATTHHVMPYFLRRYMADMSTQAFFEHFGLDAINWVIAVKPDHSRNEYYDSNQGPPGFLEPRRVVSESWRIECEDLPGKGYQTTRYHFVTPQGTLSMVLQSNEHTSWVAEHLIKAKRDIDLIRRFVTHPLCDVAAVNAAAKSYGEKGLLRGHILCFDVFGQPGTWQDACCLAGTERLILETYDDPLWVHELLRILHYRKSAYVQSLAGAHYDILELGGGSASTTVISPKLFDAYVAPYDAELIAMAHQGNQRVVYHTCGGMMPILETIAAMQPDAVETLTPIDMGGDVDLGEAKRRIGSQVCLIGGFDQYHFLSGCSPQETRAAVRRCFAAAGRDGGYILCPSDHFFDADPILIQAYADEASRCTYAS